jgi:hypothetical protein
MADELQLKIVLDTGEVVSGFLNVDKEAKRSAKNVEGSFSSFTDKIKNNIGGIAVALGAAFTTTKLVGFLRDAAREASEAEKATNALSASLAQIGKFSQGAVEGFSEFATTLQATTGIQDDLIKQNAALLVSLGNLSGTALEQATKASLDLAQALQIDVGTAFDLVAKASTGNTTALSRYGLKIDENIPKSEKFATTLKLIEDRFGGLSETRLNTFSGSLDNLTNAFGEIQEAVGGFIVNSPALRAVINTISTSLFEFSKSIGEFGKTSGDIFGQAIQGALEFGKIIVSFVIAPIEKFVRITIFGVQVITTAFQGLIALLGQFPEQIVSGLIQPLINGFGFVAEKIISLFDSKLASKIKDNITGFGSAIREGTTLVAESTTEVFTDSFNSLSESAKNAFGDDVSSTVFSFFDKLQVAAANATATTAQFKNSLQELPAAVVPPLLSVGAAFGEFVTGFKASIDDFALNAKKNFQEVGKAAFQTLGRGVGQAFAAFGQALASGEDAGKAFLQSLIGVFADIAIQLGTSYILQGIAASVNPLTPGIGGPLIAAGAALATFGGLLKGLAGGKSTTQQQSVGGGIAAAPSPTTELTPEQNLTRQEPGTAVQLIVQGDIFDSDSTASRLTDLLNESFDKKGLVIQRGAFA